jgi:hypothetical protein
MLSASAGAHEGKTMGKDLQGFVAEGIEFIIGGTVFLASVVVLLFAVGWLPVKDDVNLSDQLGTAGVTFLAIACAYAAGVIIEGASRLIFERVLDRMTLRLQAFWEEPAAPPPADPESTDEEPWFLGRGMGWHWNAEETLWEWREDKYTGAELKKCVARREYQRTHVMAAHPGLANEIGAQLKRLRLERIAFASGLVVMAAFLVSAQLWAAVAWAFVLLVLGLLVFQRLQRYAGTIARAYVATQVLHVEAEPTPGQVEKTTPA